MRIDIEQDGIARIALDVAAIARNARQLRPLGYKVRTRWHESETRTFTRGRARLAPRSGSTLRRYRYPVRRWRKGGRGPMRTTTTRTTIAGIFTGDLKRALTKPQQPGIRDTINASRGQLNVVFGIKGRGPVAHGILLDGGAGNRPARPIVLFDAQAERDAAQDTTLHLLGSWGRT